MKCLNCGKMLDHIDCDCDMCTFCGTEFDKTKVAPAENK